jgi:hypothetical protein
MCLLPCTHDAYDVFVLLMEVMPGVSLPRYDLYNKDTETEHIRFRGVLSTHHVLRRHVATATRRISTMFS